jgi:hypothetical protein
VIAAGAYRSNANPRAVLASCDTFEVRYGVPFVSVEDDTAAALLVERWEWLLCREIVSQANDLARGSDSGGGLGCKALLAAGADRGGGVGCKAGLADGV